MRNPKRLKEVRQLPCVHCGNPNSQAAHSNSSKHGKGRGIKASDEYTVPLCHVCHSALDRYELGSRAESEKLFEKWLMKVELMTAKQDDPF